MKFKEWFLLESNQEIINLGYPLIIAKIFTAKFGKNAFLIARWFKEYYSYYGESKDWWRQLRPSLGQSVSLPDLTFLYNATSDAETYMAAKKHLDLHVDKDAFFDPDEKREIIKKEIEEQLSSNVFFTSYSIIQDIENGILLDVAPYKKLTFQEAQLKYDEKRVFKDRMPIKQYKNGFKWIDVGKRCHLVGKLMKNCGSAGVMSIDKDRTIIALFDVQNKPHIVVTYSPNEKRISGDEGIASSEAKAIYHKYILDLANILNVEFDTEGSKSQFLKMKYLLKNKATNIREFGGTYNKRYSFTIQGNQFYSNGYVAVPKEDLERLKIAINRGEIKLRNNQNNILNNAFNHYNQSLLADFGVRYIPLKQL